MKKNPVMILAMALMIIIGIMGYGAFKAGRFYEQDCKEYIFTDGFRHGYSYGVRFSTMNLVDSLAEFKESKQQ